MGDTSSDGEKKNRNIILDDIDTLTPCQLL